MVLSDNPLKKNCKKSVPILCAMCTSKIEDQPFAITCPHWDIFFARPLSANKEQPI